MAGCDGPEEAWHPSEKGAGKWDRPAPGRLLPKREREGKGAAQLGHYTLSAERPHLHGAFSRERPPVLTIQPGDTVRFSTMISSWQTGPDGPVLAPRDPEADRGHALTGPVAIEGAKPHDMLAVRVEQVRPAAWGQSGAGGGPWGLNREMGLEGVPRLRMGWTLDENRRTAANAFGHRVRVAPFMGVMGMPDSVAGWQSTIPPRRTGGNIDCRELVAGSTLYLPVGLPEGLFSVGDGHAAQGDGEVGGVAIECPMEQVDLTFSLEADPLLSTPYAATPAGWITFGFDADLDQAAMAALDAMLALMVKQLDLHDRAHALALATAVVDMRVTQLVNQVRGVHAVLRQEAFALL